MQSFKQFYNLFLERKYFSDLQTKLLGVTSQLKKQFDNLKELKIGDTFILNLTKSHTVNIKILDKLPNDISVSNPSAYAYYDPDIKTVFLAVSQLYGDSTPDILRYIKEKFPPQFEELIRHELSHAYEDIVTDVYKHTHHKKMDFGDETKNYTKYINSTSELNAYLNQWLPSALKYNSVLKKLFAEKNINDLTPTIINILNNKQEFYYILKKNKKWFYKTVYTILSNLMKSTTNKNK